MWVVKTNVLEANASPCKLETCCLSRGRAHVLLNPHQSDQIQNPERSINNRKCFHL